MNEHFGITIDDETAYRERATVLLDMVAEQARVILRNAGIGIDLISEDMRRWLDTNPTRSRPGEPAPVADPHGSSLGRGGRILSLTSA